MTSSLVGSEMCIRDRSSVVGRPYVHSRTVRLRFRTRQFTPGGQGKSLAVSYTHLTLPTICSV
eukprot:9085484-Prorocentrum_lima.AAC.1